MRVIREFNSIEKYFHCNSHMILALHLLYYELNRMLRIQSVTQYCFRPLYWKNNLFFYFLFKNSFDLYFQR